MATDEPCQNGSDLEATRGFSRRQFVKLSGLGVLTIGFLGACSDSDNEDDRNPEPQGPSSAAVPPEPSFFPQSIASGDPRSDSLVFWTRIQDNDLPGQDYQARLVIALDESFTNVVMDASFIAQVQFDGVIKVQVMQLSPETTYFYQFQYQKGNRLVGSQYGRTRTAPLPDRDTPVRFGFISCQDYRNRYYNCLTRMADMDLDFVVHLGDYIYETTAGGTVKMESERDIAFSEPDQAIDLGNGRLAARSLGNYRDLYKLFKSDPMLQRIHERFPMINIWDDHEFSNDSWQASGTYFEGARDEWDEDRKRNAERAFAEFIPSGFGINALGALAPGNETFYPNTRIYQDFRFGRHVHLIMTDSRSFRPDHQIPETAFPASIVVTQSNLALALFTRGIVLTEDVKAIFDAYISLANPQYSAYKQVFTQMLMAQYLDAGMEPGRAESLTETALGGFLGISYLNDLLAAYNSTQPGSSLPLLERAGLEVGVSYRMLGKLTLLGGGGLGSRNFVVKDTFDLVAALAFRFSQGASENVFGADQEQWLIETISNSTATWRVLGSSVSATSLLLDLRENRLVPELFRQRFYLALDQWDGFPNKREQLLQMLAAHPQQNAVLIAGDIHASHAARHGNGVFEFTVCGVSSESFKGFMRAVVQGPPFTDVVGIQGMVENAESLFLAASPIVDEARGLKQMAFTKADVHGFAVIEADATGLVNTFYHLDENEVFENQYESAGLDNKFNTVSFLVADGQLKQQFKA